MVATRQGEYDGNIKHDVAPKRNDDDNEREKK